MKRTFVQEAILARRAVALGYLFLAVTSGAALAQTTTGAVNQGQDPAQAAAKDDMPPPGGCTPIGLTVSGEIVFPFSCKDFIERHKAMAPNAAFAQEPSRVAEDKPAVTEDKPAAAPEEKPAAAPEKPAAVDNKPAVKQTESAAPEVSKPATRPSEPVPLPKRAEQKRTQLAMDPMCKHFRSYNPTAGTYKGFDGRMRPCK
jgi:BA14K-like protein